MATQKPICQDFYGGYALSGPSQQELQKGMSDRSDEQLRAILLSPSGEYTDDALNAARDEIRRRGMDPSQWVPVAGTPAAIKEESRQRQNFILKWIWPALPDEPSARSAIKGGFWACIFIVVANTAIGVYALEENQKVGGYYDAWALVDAALFAIIAWRLWKNSRAWSVIGLILWTLELIDKLRNATATFGVVTILLFLAFVSAARGTFVLHRLRMVKGS
jgi:hypothetical protein